MQLPLTVSKLLSTGQKRFRTAPIGFIHDTLRKLEIFVMEKIDRSIRPFTSSETKSLIPVLMEAEQNLSEEEYHHFRKFVKVTFDLGSVSVYEHPVKRLYHMIQLHLQESAVECREEEKSARLESVLGKRSSSARGRTLGENRQAIGK